MKYLALQLHILSKCTHIYVRLVSVLKAKSKKLIVGSFIIVSAFGLAFSPTGLPIHTAQAAVAYDAVSHDTVAAAGATTTITWSHTPIGTPKGVLVYVVQGTLATDQVTSVTYGSLTLTRVAIVCDRQAEPGCVYAYFGGSGIPTGAQTVTVNVSGASGKHASAITYTAGTDTRVTNFVSSSEDETNPSDTLGLFGKSSHVSVGLYSGVAAVTNITPTTGWTSRYEDDFGAFQGGFYTYDTVGTSDVTAGWTQASDDMALLAVGVSEVDTVTQKTIFETPGTQEFTVPAGITEISVKAWGAGGGAGGGGNVANGLGGGAGGAGGYARGIIPVTPGETLDITVGVGGAGGAPGISSWGGVGGAGGGRTEVSRSGNSLLVAAGGGGGGGGDDAITSAGGAGGAGGDIIAGDSGIDASSGSSEANGAQQGGGGAGGTGTFNTGTNGGLKTAGDGADGSVNSTDGTANNSYAIDDGDGGLHSANNAGGGGGGGGYYGGGGGGVDTGAGGDGGGGGVAYFASTTAAGIAVAGSGVTPGNSTDADFDSDHAGGAPASVVSTRGTDGEHGMLVIEYSYPVEVNGTLYEADGVTPVTSGKTVSLIATSTVSVHSTTTDASGNFSLTTAPMTFTEGGERWTAGPQNDDSGWIDVTYGNGTFVAVSPCAALTGADCAMYSTDNGATWATTTVAGDDEAWYGVTYGNGTFVAVAFFCGLPLGTDCVVTSPDGITWTPRSSAGDNHSWQDVAYGDGTFVAVGNSTGASVAMYSLDNGVTWATTTAAGDNDPWQAVTYGNGTFVAVTGYDSGDPHLVMTSPDGITWTPRSVAGNDDYWRGVAYGNGKFVAVGNCNDNDSNPRDCIMYSTDNGATWATTTSPGGTDAEWSSVVYGDDGFVAVATDSCIGDSYCVMTSPDGITWTLQSAVGDNDAWMDIAYGNGTFVAGGIGANQGGGGDDVIMTSSVIFNQDTPITLFVDNDTNTKATTLFKLGTTTSTFSDIDLYNGSVRVQYATSSGSIDFNSDTFYDTNADPDILLEMTGATTSIGSIATSASLVVATGTELIGPENLVVYGDFTNTGDLVMGGTTLYLEGTDPTLDGSFVGSNTLGDVVVNPQSGVANWARMDLQLGGTAITYNGEVYVLVGACGESEGGPVTECIFTSSDGSTWATSTDITEGYWSDVTYGEGIFVAVGACTDPWGSETYDCIMTSSDGVSWATTTSPDGDGDSWYSVSYGNGTFVAVGYNIILGSSTAMYSDDGITWNTPTLPGNDDNWTSVTYGNGTFVAVGNQLNENSNIVMTSPDGINWTAHSAAGDDDTWTGVSYGEGTFVAVGQNCYDRDCAMYSFDGINWATTTADENNDYWRNVTYGGGNFAAVGFAYNPTGSNNDDSIMTSPDGINWTTRGASVSSLYDVVYANGNYIAVGSGVAGTKPLTTFATASTSNLTIYENKELTTSNPLSVDGDLLSYGVFTNNSELYLTGSNRTVTLADPNIGNVIVTSNVEFLSNATTTELTVTSAGSLDPYNALTVMGDFTQNGSVDFSGTKVYLDEVGVVNGNFTGANAFEDVIIDATSWDVHTNPAPSDQWFAMAYGNGTFVAVGDCTDEDITCVMTSSDGFTWATTSTPDALGGQWQDIIYDNGLFVAVSSYSNGDYVMTSPDGINWTGRSLPANFPSNGWSGVAYGSSTFVAVGVECEYADYCVMTSPDGATWTAQSALGDNDFWGDVTYGEGLFVAVGTTDSGADNSIMTSPDGITWTARTAATTSNEFGWYQVAYGNGVFVGSDGFSVVTSPDGITWTEGSNDFGGGLTEITFGDGFFMSSLGYSGSGYYVTSPDGVTWTIHYSDVFFPQWATAYGDDMFVAIGRDIFTSSNTTSFQDNAEFSDLEILNGSTIVSSSTITLTGNYTNNGSLAGTGSEFVLAGTAQQTFAGNMTDSSAFDDLTITNTSEDGETDQSIIFTNAVDTTGTFSMSAGTSAQFPAGSTSTLQSVDLRGTSSNEVYLRSSTADSDWYLDIPGSQIAVEYVNVKDSNASSTVVAINSTDSGNNTNWNFGTGATSWNATDWTLYDTVTIDHTKVGETLTDFPVYVDLSDLSSQFWSTTPSASSTVGTDIRVTNSSDEELPRELVFASSTAQTGELHFKADSISSTTDTVFKIWYNGNTAGDYATNATYGAENVWTNDFVAVYHMQEDPSAVVLDSTSFANNGTGGIDMTSADLVAGKFGKANDFDGSATDSINFGSSASLDNISPLTISTWYQHDTFPTTYPMIMDKSSNGGDGPNFYFYDAGEIGLYTIEQDATQSAYTPGGGSTWDYLSSTWDGNNGSSTIRNYINGVNQAVMGSFSGGGTSDDSSYNLRLGSENSGSNYLDGRLDEVRISSSTRSADWIAAEYYNQSTTTDFYSIESYPPGFTGSTTISDHDAGQVSNAFSNQNKTNTELFAFKLTPETGTATVTSMVIRLSGAKNVSAIDFSNVRLYQDNDNDGNYDPTDTQIDGAGDMTLSGQTGSITFSTDFVLSSTNNYLVVADWNAPSNGAFLKIELLQSGVTATQDEGVQQILGSVTSIQHARNNRGGGGSSSAQIGGAPPASEDVGGGDDQGGEEIGDNPDYKRPTAGSGSWTNGERAYNQVDGSYATTNAVATHSYSDANLGVAGGVTLDGVEVRMEVSGTTAAGTIGVQLSWDGGTSWTSSKSTPTLTTSDVVVTLGGPADIWGRTWTVNDFSNANFRIRLTGAPNSNTVRVDEIQVRVYSSVSGGGGGGGGDI